MNGDDGEESGVCGFARRRLRLVIETGSFFWLLAGAGFRVSEDDDEILVSKNNDTKPCIPIRFSPSR